MKRNTKLQTTIGGRSGMVIRPASFVGPISAIFAGMTLWIVITSQSLAGTLPEIRSLDAQIARGVIERPGTTGESAHRENRIQTLIPDAERNCLRGIDQPIEVDRRSRSKAQQQLAVALQHIRHSDIGAWLVRFAAAHEVTICLDHATKLEAHYRSHLGLLGISARLGPASRVVFLAHELAHVPQHPRFSNNRRFSPEDMLLLQQVREAAAEAVATRVLWQLKQQGWSAPWQAKLTTAYHDIAESFETTMADGEGVARELWATRSAFLHWFDADWRREIYDDLMFKTLARIADDSIGLIPASRQLSDRFLRGVADYAGQGFLIKGDGQALIKTFRTRRLRTQDQARLDAILAKTKKGADPTLSLLASESPRSPPSHEPLAEQE